MCSCLIQLASLARSWGFLGQGSQASQDVCSQRLMSAATGELLALPGDYRSVCTRGLPPRRGLQARQASQRLPALCPVLQRAQGALPPPLRNANPTPAAQTWLKAPPRRLPLSRLTDRAPPGQGVLARPLPQDRGRSPQ